MEIKIGQLLHLHPWLSLGSAIAISACTMSKLRFEEKLLYL